MALLVSIPLALIAARRPNGVIDRLSMAFSMTGVSTANYVLAVILVWLFADVVRAFPAIGFVSIGTDFGENLRSLTLPQSPWRSRSPASTRAAARRPARADAARGLRHHGQGQGAGPWRVILRHGCAIAVRVITVIALKLGTLLGAVVITSRSSRCPASATA